MQNADFIWYIEHRAELFSEYGSTYLVIKDKKILGTSPVYGDAVRMALQKEAHGTFIVQKCGQDESSYTNYISSMNFCN